MKKTYLVKKNPNMPDSEDNWIMMNGFEFARFMETPEGQSRKDNFGQLDSCGDGDDIIVAECGAEKSKEWRAEKDAHDYLVEQEIESGIETLSFDALDSEEDEVTGEELMVDENCDVVAEVERNIDKESIRLGLENLTSLQKDIIICLFLSDEPMSEVEYAARHNVKQQTVHVLKKRALKKMKKYF